ncbi:MAG: iron chelate uptake ABC transporter family permease subunit [Pikeienuella sp.]|uniref:iron chelate uptake ABC transporter family permease subunit n=1 Tax=Pikeienuella sp. TaxID=2831957 RepID=UPI003919966D
MPGRPAGAAALLAALSVASLFVGAAELRPAALAHDAEALRLLAVSRAPRTLAAALVGASLGVSGLVMQMLARSRFVEPTTAGAGSGAALGILLTALLWPGAGILSSMAIATLTALLASAGFLLLIRRLPPTETLLIPIVALIHGSVIGAAVAFLAYQADLLQYLDIWLNGEFSGVIRGRYELVWAAGALAALAYLHADRLTVAGLGRDAAVGLGLAHGRIVAVGLLIVAAIAALTVSTVGAIPFVGLVAPNIASRLMGDNIRRTLPWTAWLGAVLVLGSDLLGRLVIHPPEDTSLSVKLARMKPAPQL